MLKEYRICMPMTVEEYHIGQLYMIARHSAEQSDDKGEGVETIVNEPCEDPKYGKGQYAEKRIHLTSKLPSWIRSYMPRFIYVTEKSWNFYPYTITEYTCSIIPKFCVKIWTRYENNNGSNNNVHAGTCPGETATIDFIDIATDEVRPHQYKEDEDPCKFRSVKTGRGPLSSGWRDQAGPIMCSYKLVQVSFPVFGLQTRVEDFVHKEVRNINVLSHRQAFVWMDEWHGWTMSDVRAYEARMQETTNLKIRQALKSQVSGEYEMELDDEGNVVKELSSSRSSSSVSTPSTGRATTPSGGATTPVSADAAPKQGSYFSSFFKLS
ncbi:cytoplasmic phosphatidylinositol transfer protein 1 [Hyalella azteca]|uniref:Cytoplasmic phosphatidylinositol transfer protein 1 n=1 Tax=Hyalella azteca TaxID=294128 RepID=A0A8B7NL78_HYAAZ|nr:cytoplasmic phosphatidylinositol transfer protein 1 [Hyalella azteca]